MERERYSIQPTIYKPFRLASLTFHLCHTVLCPFRTIEMKVLRNIWSRDFWCHFSNSVQAIVGSIAYLAIMIASCAKKNASVLHLKIKQNSSLLSSFGLYMYVQIRIIKCCIATCSVGFGWLVVLGLTALWDSISVYIGPSPREAERKEKRKTREKMSKQPPPAPIASAICPCPTIIHISRTPRHWKLTQHLRTTGPSPCSVGI